MQGSTKPYQLEHRLARREGRSAERIFQKNTFRFKQILKIQKNPSAGDLARPLEKSLSTRKRNRH